MPCQSAIQLFLKPNESCIVDGIDILLYEEHCILLCTIRFSKLIVTDDSVATTRIPSAFVGEEVIESGIYIGEWFLRNDKLLEVVHISDSLVTYSYVEEERKSLIQLPAAFVDQQIAVIGNS
jgi:hypothetical protein